MNFPNAPQSGKSKDTQDGRKDRVFDEQRGKDTNDAYHQKYWPDFHPEIIFRFDHDGMENPNDDKCRQTDYCAL